MATYQPPTEDLTDFNSSVFKTANESTLTLSDAQALFLGRTGTPTSVATTTTFSSGDLMIQGATFGLGGGGTINNGNVACGDSALLSNSTGNKNTAVGGYAALGGNLTGSSNTAVGDRCLQNSDANNNVGVGASCLSANNTGFNNTAVGTTALAANTTGSRNVAIGFEAFKTGTIYNNSIALGANTVVAGNQAVAIGYLASASDSQIVLGTTAETVLCKGTTGNGSLIASADIFVNGVRAGVGKFQTDTNTCFGKDSLITTTSLGINNAAFGNSALKLQAGGANCSAFGSGALATTTAEGNTGVGALAGNAISSGIKNTAVGSACLKFVNTGNRNTGCGYAAGFVFAGGASDNTYIGCHRDNYPYTGGSTNTFVGSQSILGPGTGTTNLNVNASTALGAFTSVGGFSNSTAIGGGTSIAVPGAVCTAINQIMLGRATETVECPGTASSISLKTASNISVNGAVFGIGSGETNSLFCGLTVGTANGENNTIYGRATYDAATDGSSDRNTIIGANASNTGYAVMSDHTVVGYGAGGKNSTASQQGITCLGSGANVLNNASNSTAIGMGAQATLASQIILGTSTEFVECAGTDDTNGCLKLNGGLKLQTAYGAVPSATMLGYKVITTGSAVILTSTTISNLVDVAVPIGVWNVSFSVSVTVTAGGNVTAQNIVFSETTASTTALSTICGQNKKHSSETYATDDVYIVSNSFEYQTTSATNIYLNMVCTFSGGAGLTATGYVSLTRIG